MQNKRIIAILSGWFEKKSDGLWHSTDFSDLKDHHGAPGGYLRIVAGSLLFKKNPDRSLLVLGEKGKSKLVLPKELFLSSIMKRELIELGVPENKVMEERKTNSTYEQLKALVVIADNNTVGQIDLISNRYHLPRIRAMLDFGPDLKGHPSAKKINLVEAEKVLLDSDYSRWNEVIQKAYDSSELQELIAKEKEGAEQIRSGTYKYLINI
ncbi:YdcF family protein [Candidatus Giovannonibacteria bacterium]|nr:YdcF family protein [Candidatus Giovannonibacteria bacterium]